MLNLSQKSPVQNHGKLIQNLIFFTLFYLYIWLKIDPRLIYHGGGVITNFPVFYRTLYFFLQFISYPGGPLEYLCAFLSQFLYYSWAGAAVITLQASLLCICTDTFIKAINAHRFRWVRFIPPMLLLITYNRYTYHFVTAMALLASLFFVCLYLKVTGRSKPVSLLVFFFLSVILYYIAGGAYLLFAVLCALYELLFSRRWQLALIYLLSAAVIPYVVGVSIIGISILDAFTKLLPFSWETLNYESCKIAIIMLYILYLLLLLTIFGFGLWWAFVKNLRGLAHQQHNSPQTKSKFNKKIKKTSLEKKLPLRHIGSPVLRLLIESAFLFLIAGSIAFLTHDQVQKTVLEVDYYAYNKMWPQVLRAARRYPNSYFIVHTANRALYHTGQLGSEMFSFYQTPHTLFLTLEEYADVYWKKFDMYLDLGYVNKAEHELCEALAAIGEHPLILKRLALINMVKENSASARIYLELLSKTLFHADWANSYLDRLKRHPNLSNDDQILRLRQLMVDEDRTWQSFENEQVLLDLLNKNRKNRMAFEYLMAWYLLTKQLDKFVQNLNRLDDFDYSQLPRHYEEAILLYTFDRKKSIDLHGRQISLDSQRRFENFKHILVYYRGNTQMAYADLERNCRNSYLFYYIYGLPR